MAGEMRNQQDRNQQERNGRQRSYPHVWRGVLEALVLLSVPIVLVCCAVWDVKQSAGLTLFATVAALVLFFLGYERSRQPLSVLMATVVLASLAAASRILLAPVPQVKPLSAIAIIAGATFGRTCGFAVGALAALLSNFFFGQGPWTPWQMYAWGMVGYGAGVLCTFRWFQKPVLLYAYGLLSGLLYGFILNAWYAVGFIRPFTGAAVVTACVAGFPFDLTHGVATVVFLLILYAPWRKKLERIKNKYLLD